MNTDTTQVEAQQAPGAVPEGSPKSAVGTLIGIFTEPKPTFQSLHAKPRILAPILVVVLVQLIFGFMLAQTGVMKNDAIAKLEAQEKPQEQIDAVNRIMDSPV